MPIAVQVAPVEVGAISEEQVLSGALEAKAVQVVTAQIGGQIVRLDVDLGDGVSSGQEVARLEDGEHRAAVAQAVAALAGAQASVVEAESALHLAVRERDRVVTLSAQGAASAGAQEQAETEVMTRTAALEVAAARVTQAEASL